MSIGERRMRVVFQSATLTQTGTGASTQTWATLATQWALVQPLSGSERFAAHQVKGEVTTRIVTRASSELATLAPDDRATWNGHTYDIKAVIHRDHRRKEIEIMAVEHL